MMHLGVKFLAACGLSLTMLSSVYGDEAERPAGTQPTLDIERLIHADQDQNNWLSNGRTYDEDRQSPLTQITGENVQQLGLAWAFDTGTRRGLEATPIVVDGMMYTTGSWSKVFANNAKTGELLWSYDPQVDRAWGVNACCDVVNRGVAVLDDKLFVGTIDGRLIAVNRFSGDLIWETLTIDKSKPYTITGAPRVINDTVIIGNGGAEYGVRGYVSAYKVNDGELKWRFYTVPGDPALPPESAAMAMAAKTWTGDVFYKIGGGGTVWDSMAFDPELNLLYIGVGNGSPWNRKIRSPGGGDNLFLSSIVALDGSTGQYVWHYQTTPADNWDYTATQHIILKDIEIRGEVRKVLMQAPKNGFFYVIDRQNGELISAKKYVPISWASHVDIETGRPVETENADYSIETQLTRPAPFGGHNWQPMAYNDTTGLVYIPAMENMSAYSTPESFEYLEGGHWNIGQNDGPESDDQMSGLNSDLLMAVLKHMLRGKLIAWDPVKQEAAWQVEHKTMWNGGLLTTASGLVFQGNGSGDFVAYDGATGERLWSHNVGNGIIAAPMSYQIDGEQYVAVMAGWGGAVGLVFDQPEAIGGGPGRLLVYKLGGKKTLAKIDHQRVLPKPPKLDYSDEEIELGTGLYNVHCMRCHGIAVRNGGVIADLRYMSEGSHQIFDDIVLGGVFSGLGMVSFADVLSKSDTKAIHGYITQEAHIAWENEQASEWWIDTRDWVYDKLGAAAGAVF